MNEESHKQGEFERLAVGLIISDGVPIKASHQRIVLVQFLASQHLVAQNGACGSQRLAEAQAALW